MLVAREWVLLFCLTYLVCIGKGQQNSCYLQGTSCQPCVEQGCLWCSDGADTGFCNSTIWGCPSSYLEIFSPDQCPVANNFPLNWVVVTVCSAVGAILVCGCICFIAYCRKRQSHPTYTAIPPINSVNQQLPNNVGQPVIYQQLQQPEYVSNPEDLYK